MSQSVKPVPGQASPDSERPVLDAGELLRGHSAVVLEYMGQRYRLSVTRSGKLILTK